MRQIDPLWFLVAIFPISSLAGLAALLRKGEVPTRLEVVSTVLNSGFFGVMVAAVGIQLYGMEAIYFLFGVSVLAGLGGNSMLIFILTLVQVWIEKQTGIKRD